jgi:hypothetical protein
MTTSSEQGTSRASSPTAADREHYVAVRVVRPRPTRSADVLTLLRIVRSLVQDPHQVRVAEQVGVGVPLVAIVFRTAPPPDSPDDGKGVERVTSLLDDAGPMPSRWQWLPRGVQRGRRARLRDALATLAELTVDVDDWIGQVMLDGSDTDLFGGGHAVASVTIATPTPASWAAAEKLVSAMTARTKVETALGAVTVKTVGSGRPRLVVAVAGSSLEEIAHQDARLLDARPDPPGTAPSGNVDPLAALGTIETTLWRLDDGAYRSRAVWLRDRAMHLLGRASDEQTT